MIQQTYFCLAIMNVLNTTEAFKTIANYRADEKAFSDSITKIHFSANTVSKLSNVIENKFRDLYFFKPILFRDFFIQICRDSDIEFPCI